MTGKHRYCSLLMQSLQVFIGDSQWPPLNVNTGSQTVKLLWLQGKDDISIMLWQHWGLSQVWRLLCPVPNPLLVLFFFHLLRAYRLKMCGGHIGGSHQIIQFTYDSAAHIHPHIYFPETVPFLPSYYRLCIWELPVPWASMRATDVAATAKHA